ncbi:TPA: tail fiber assembly protein, partial [Citrobacter amalonaticus]
DSVVAEFNGKPPEGKMRGVVYNMPAWVDLPLPTREEAIATAEQKKSELLIAAQATIINWQSKLLLGVISDDEKTSLIAWLAYIDALNSVDTANPNWPDPPEA